MRVIKDYRNIRLKQPVIATMGIFDGVHPGHREIITRCVNRARSVNGTSCVITFYPHPLKIVSPVLYPPLLMSIEQRLEIFKNLGVDLCLLINFNKKFARLSAENFVRDILAKALGVKEFIIGYNLRFGFAARGNIRLLDRLSREHGFRLTVLKALKYKGRGISSTYVRDIIAKGDLSLASRLLGRSYSIFGEVVRGNKRGTRLGFPTANIETLQEVLPPRGVYAARVSLKKQTYMGMLNIGVRPTFIRERAQIKPRIEVHLLGVDKILYGNKMEIFPVKRIRDEKKFKDKYGLIEQLRKDEVIARIILRSNTPN
jgi:riboflavin kinase/FMN adenylyltransferase